MGAEGDTGPVGSVPTGGTHRGGGAAAGAAGSQRSCNCPGQQGKQTCIHSLALSPELWDSAAKLVARKIGRRTSDIIAAIASAGDPAKHPAEKAEHSRQHIVQSAFCARLRLGPSFISASLMILCVSLDYVLPQDFTLAPVWLDSRQPEL